MLNILCNGSDRFYRSSVPVILLAIYYGIKITLVSPYLWLTFMFWIAYLAIAAFYAVTVSGHIKSTIPLLLLLILVQWAGIFLTTFSTILTNLLAGLFFFVALASWVMKLADGGEVLKMLITAFVVFVLPYIAIAAIAKISFFADELRDFLQS